MKNTETNKQNLQEQLPTQENAESNLKEDSTSGIEQIENTPFKIVCVEDKYFLAILRTRLTEYMQSREEVLEYLANNHWMITLQLIVHVIDTMQTEDYKKFEANRAVYRENNADIN